MTVEKVLKLYEQYLVEKGNKRKSIDENMRRLRVWHESTTPISEITPSKLKKMYRKRVEKLAADSHRNELAVVKTFWKWVVKKGWATRSPADDIEPIGRRRKGKPQLMEGEAQRLFDTAFELALKGDEGALAVLLALLHGLRSKEIRQLKVRHVDIAAERVVLWVAFEDESGKTKAAKRRMALEEPLASLLTLRASGRPADGYLFPSNSSTGYRSGTWLLKNVKRLCKTADVPVVPPHGLRGTWSTLAEGAGVVGQLVTQELGQVHRKTTEEHYTRPEAISKGRTRRVLRVLQGGLEEKGLTRKFDNFLVRPDAGKKSPA
jgi:integrase